MSGSWAPIEQAAVLMDVDVDVDVDGCGCGVKRQPTWFDKASAEVFHMCFSGVFAVSARHKQHESPQEWLLEASCSCQVLPWTGEATGNQVTLLGLSHRDTLPSIGAPRPVMHAPIPVKITAFRHWHVYIDRLTLNSVCNGYLEDVQGALHPIHLLMIVHWPRSILDLSF